MNAIFYLLTCLRLMKSIIANKALPVAQNTIHEVAKNVYVSIAANARKNRIAFVTYRESVSLCGLCHDLRTVGINAKPSAMMTRIIETTG